MSLGTHRTRLHARSGLRFARLAVRRIRAVLGRFMAAIALVLSGLLVLVIDGHGVSWLAGLIVGGAGGAWIALLRNQTSAEKTSQTRVVARTPSAARAERRTQGAVKSLEQSGWRFLHDVRGRDSIYDHVAVGPGGVILLQSIDPQGTVTVKGGEPFVERRHDPDAEPEVARLRPRALADAGAFRDDVLRVAGQRVWVQAVVVFWSEFPAGCVTDGRCVYVHGSRLAEWMARRPHQLNDVETGDMFATVSLLTEHSGDLPLPIAL
jgi:diadenosine tetraphosphatase ApaH/serine/threonine PP2A family protein phosphatase